MDMAQIMQKIVTESKSHTGLITESPKPSPSKLPSILFFFFFFGGGGGGGGLASGNSINCNDNITGVKTPILKRKSEKGKQKRQ